MRAWDEGSVFHERGRWRAKIPAKGRRVTVTLKATTKPAAERELRDLLQQRDEHRLPLDRSTTLSDWVMHWVETADLRDTVRDRERDTLRHHVAETWLGKIRLADLEPEDLERYEAECLRGEHSTRIVRTPTGKLNRKHRPVLKAQQVPRALSPRTVVNLHAIIRSALSEAVHRHHLPWNPAAAAKAPSAPHVELQTLSATDAHLVLAEASKTSQDAARWWLGLVFGMRPGEVLGLTIDHITSDRIEIRRQLQQIRGRGQRLVDVKTAAGKHDIDIPTELHPILDAAIAWKRRAQIEAGERWNNFEQDGEPVDLLFVQRDGRPITQAVDTRRWHQILDAVGLPHVRRYIARHTAATLMLDAGIPIEVVSSILGHVKTSFTMDTYVSPHQDARKAAATRLGALWGGDTSGDTWPRN